MRTLLFALATLSLQACVSPAGAGALLDLEVVDRTSGAVLESHPHRGQRYIAGEPGARYSVRLTNRSGARVLAVLSVDGVNAISGETASPGQSGYVLEPYASAEISGWRKNMQEIAQFYFTSLPDSYAARTDRPDNVGVIGVAVYRERAAVRPMPRREAPLAKQAPAPAADGAAASRAQAADAAREMAPQAASPGSAWAPPEEEKGKLGTGHGEREYAPTEYTSFARASSSPAEVVSLRYDRRSNLLARGILPRTPSWPEPQPQPFPARFAPDPWR